MPPSTVSPPPKVYSVPNLAELLGFSAQAVYNAINRLAINPAVETAGGQKFYDEDALERLRSEMDPKCRERQLRSESEESTSARADS